MFDSTKLKSCLQPAISNQLNNLTKTVLNVATIAPVAAHAQKIGGYYRLFT